MTGQSIWIHRSIEKDNKASVPARNVFELNVGPPRYGLQLQANQFLEIMMGRSTSDANPQWGIALVLLGIVIKGHLLDSGLFLELHIDEVWLRTIRSVVNHIERSMDEDTDIDTRYAAVLVYILPVGDKVVIPQHVEAMTTLGRGH
jgi:hypothetical protein